MAKAKKISKKAKKPAVKKAVKKAAKKKIVAKKTVAKEVAAKKIVARKAPAKKLATKKPTKKPVAKKVAPKMKVVTKVTVKPVPAKAAPKAVPAPKPMVSRQRPSAVVHTPVNMVQTAKEQKALYKVGNHVVYPTHGVGKIMAEETQMIGDIELRLLVINFEKDKMTLRVPMHRAAAAGLRPISGNDKMKEVYTTLKSKAKTSRGMWSRRAQEYEAKINSGNIILISEVVRDLHQNVDQSERSYSERMIYENALNRLVGEVAAAEHTDTKTAYDKLMKLLRAKVAAAAALKEAA